MCVANQQLDGIRCASRTKAARCMFGIVLILSLAVPSVAVARQAGTTVRAFRLQFVSVMDASKVVQPILSEDGSLTLQPHKSRITVQDRPEVVERVAKALAALDQRPEQFLLRVDLLEGTDATVAARLQADVDPRLRRMFPFAAYQRVGVTRFEGAVGEAVEANLGSGYHISFVTSGLGVSEESPWHIPDPGSRLQLQSLVLERRTQGADGKPSWVEVVRTRVVLSQNQEAFIGAAGSEDSERGVVLILKAMAEGDR